MNLVRQSVAWHRKKEHPGLLSKLYRLYFQEQKRLSGLNTEVILTSFNTT